MSNELSATEIFYLAMGCDLGDIPDTAFGESKKLQSVEHKGDASMLDPENLIVG